MTRLTFDQFKSISSNHAIDRLNNRGANSTNKFVGWTPELKNLFTNPILTSNLISAFDYSLSGKKPTKKGYEFLVYKKYEGTTLAAIGVYKEGLYKDEGYGILIATYLPFRIGKQLSNYSYKDIVWLVEIDEYSNKVSINPSIIKNSDNPQLMNKSFDSNKIIVRKPYSSFRR